MIISHRKRFVFIHINKAAGTSIKNALKPYADFMYRKYTLRRALYVLGLGGPVAEHSTAVEIRERIGHTRFNDYFTFAFVRNPWDWQVSQYHYILNRPLHPQHRIVKSLNGFAEYLEWHIEHDKMSQKRFVTDERDNLLVDYIGRFENIASDFAAICERIGLECRLPHVNVSDHSNYRQYYDDRTAHLVAEQFQEDIEFFGYHFDEPDELVTRGLQGQQE